MENITLMPMSNMIDQARLLAKRSIRTLNAMFREWLERFTCAKRRHTGVFDSLMKRLTHVSGGGASSAGTSE